MPSPNHVFSNEKIASKSRCTVRSAKIKSPTPITKILSITSLWVKFGGPSACHLEYLLINVCEFINFSLVFGKSTALMPAIFFVEKVIKRCFYYHQAW